MPDTRDQLIQSYLDRGWAILPLKPRSKEPLHSNWVNTTFTLADFDESCNVGVKTGPVSNRLVDVDLDLPEAGRAADIMLPRTLISGRRGKPSSHYWYLSDGPTMQLKDLDNRMIVELRTNGQTVLPPSIHQSGDAVVWENTREPLSRDPKELALDVTLVAIATLLGQHWPSGNRHYAAGHIAGLLVRAGVSLADIERVIRGACAAAGDTEVADRVTYARTTVEEHQAGKHVSGGKKLTEMMPRGPEVITRIFSWLGREGEDQIEILNTQHFVVQIGKSMAVGTESSVKGEEVSFQNYLDFQQLYFNRRAGKQKLGLYWLEHPARRTYRRLKFAPPHSKVTVSPRDYNLWRGFAVEPDTAPHPETRCALFLAHIREVIAGGVPEHAEWVMDFLADIVQRPGDPPGKALALRGLQGVGKSVFVEAFGALFGRHFLAVKSRDELLGKFNAHLSGRIVVFADEAIWGGHRQDVGSLKHMTTQTHMNIQRKGIDIVTEPNCIHLILATNEDWVWPAGNRERRGVILDLPKHIQTREYFDALVAEIHEPTFHSALLAVLLARQVNYPRLRAGLDTEALREQQEFSSDPVQQWWKMILEDGCWEGQPWPDALPEDTIYKAFTTAMGSFRGAGMSHLGTRMQLIKRLLDLMPATASREARYMSVNVTPYGAPVFERRLIRCVVLPSVEACRDFYNLVAGTKHKWQPLGPAGKADLPFETEVVT